MSEQSLNAESQVQASSLLPVSGFGEFEVGTHYVEDALTGRYSVTQEGQVHPRIIVDVSEPDIGRLLGRYVSR